MASELQPIGIVDDESVLLLAAAKPARARPRRLLPILLAVLTAQYTLVAIGVSLSAAAGLHYVAAPQIVARFEAVVAALKR